VEIRRDLNPIEFNPTDTFTVNICRDELAVLILLLAQMREGALKDSLNYSIDSPDAVDKDVALYLRDRGKAFGVLDSSRIPTVKDMFNDALAVFLENREG
jgi:hypothetical protein